MQKGTGGVMGEHEIFKTTIMGGFDKEDVLEQVQRMKDEAAAEQLRLKKLISEKDAKIAELMKRIELKDAHQERLEMEIHEKYQKYIDNYESIGKLVFDAQLKSDAMIKDAEEKCNTMISEAEAEAKQRVEAVQSEIDDKLRDSVNAHPSSRTLDSTVASAAPAIPIAGTFQTPKIKTAFSTIFVTMETEPITVLFKVYPLFFMMHR